MSHYKCAEDVAEDILILTYSRGVCATGQSFIRTPQDILKLEKRPHNEKRERIKTSVTLILPDLPVVNFGWPHHFFYLIPINSSKMLI